MLTPEQRVELVREAMDRGHFSQLGDGGPEAIAEQIREAVAAERERCAGIIDREREEDGDPQQLRNLLAAIREGAVSDAPAAKTAPAERLIFTDQDGDRLEITRVFGMGERMAALFVRDPNDPDDECGININLENATKLRDWLNEFLL